VKHSRPSAGRGAHLAWPPALHVTRFKVVPRGLQLFQLAQPDQPSARCACFKVAPALADSLEQASG
jgi:hypothetical protein